MKRFFSILGFILVSVLAVSCIEPWEEPAGKFSISFGGTNGSARSLYEDREQLTFTIKLSGGPGADQSVKDIKYGQTVNFSVVPGRWDIYVAAWLDGVVKADHSRTVVIKPGRNDPIKITLDDKGNVIVECNHEWSDWEITEAATCVAPGIGSRVCEICNAEETEIPIDPNAHNFGASAKITKEATCDDEDGEGEEEGTCELCGKKTTKTLAKLAHDWGEWVVNPAPTHTTEGVETETCTHDPLHTRETRPVSRIPFTSVAEFGTWLNSQTTNTTATAYTINLQTDDITGIEAALGGPTGDKYVYLDLTGSTMTSIANSTFGGGGQPYGIAALVGITIPDSVTSIGDNAFYYCTNLASVTIPDSVTSIGTSAFYECTSLASVTIGSGVTSIGSGAFSQTAWLNNQPDGLLYVGKVAFQYIGTMPANTIINILDGTKAIGQQAFSGCTGLASITIPNSVTSEIGDSTFGGCTNLASVTIGNSVTSIGNWTFQDCTNLSSVTIGNNVTSIGNSAFERCTSLTSVTIPDKVTSIGTGAFANTSLTSVTIPNKVTSIGNGAFANTALTSVTFAEGSNIADADFGMIAFPGAVNSLKTAYSTGKAGTYTLSGGVWTKE